MFYVIIYLIFKGNNYYELRNKKNEILLNIPASNDGKFRFKKRKNNLEFWEFFSTRKEIFDDNTYLEWQIGYDITLKDFESNKKHTKLSSVSFIEDNKKEKYPYELSEILYTAMKIGLVNENDIKNLFDEISKYKNFIDEKAITVEHHSKLKLNGIEFEETSIKLPTLFMLKTVDNTQIEISIQKQRYASGIQPMIYYCIPFKSFRSYSLLQNKSSVSGNILIYIINKENISNVLSMIKIFVMKIYLIEI